MLTPTSTSPNISSSVKRAVDGLIAVILAACSIIRDRIAFRRKIERTRVNQYLESQIGVTAHPSRRRGACHRARIRATRWRPPPAITAKPLRGDEVQLAETQQPHAEERATRASRSMGSKRLTDLSSSVLAPIIAPHSEKRSMDFIGRPVE